MPDRCPQDGGYIGKSGCTHPNHQHTERTKRLLAQPLIEISVSDCDYMLTEGFYITNTAGERVGFGKTLKKHLESHSPADVAGRKQRLLYAIDAVKTTQPELNHRGIGDRTAYAKQYDNFGILVLADRDGNISNVFNIIPKRKGAK